MSQLDDMRAELLVLLGDEYGRSNLLAEFEDSVRRDEAGASLTGWPLAAFGMFVVGCATVVVVAVLWRLLG